MRSPELNFDEIASALREVMMTNASPEIKLLIDPLCEAMIACLKAYIAGLDQGMNDAGSVIDQLVKRKGPQ